MTDDSLEIPVLLSHNDFILKQTEEIRKKIIPWEGYMKASLIEMKELELIKQYSNAGSAANTSNSNSASSEVFVKLLAKLSRVDTIQSILVLIDDQGFTITGRTINNEGINP